MLSPTTGKRVLVLGAFAVLAACSSGADSAMPVSTLTAESLGPQVPATVAEYLAESRYANASPELGDRVLFQCTACHTLNEGGAHLLGPNLHGIFGRRAGSMKGFGFTRALESATFIWTPRTMDAWVAQPAHFLPGNAMAYAGLRNEEDRDALVASLLRRTEGNGQ